MLGEFKPFTKIHRLNRDIIITEKIDGTNAVVKIEKLNPLMAAHAERLALCEQLVKEGKATVVEYVGKDDTKQLFFLQAASKSRIIWPGKGTDNFGFAQWVFDNAAQLWQLGPGDHAGEWFGHGIQRGYGYPLGTREFALFNVSKFTKDNVPLGCTVVPMLYSGPIKLQGGENAWDYTLRRLQYAGSQLVPGFRDPEGIVVYHTHNNAYWGKWTLGPEETRGKENAA